VATDRQSNSIAANTVVTIQLGPLGAPVGPNGGRARLFATQAATGCVISLSAGTRFPISRAVPNIRAATVATILRNEDGIGEVIAGPFQVFTLTVENTTGGALVVATLLDVDGIPGT